MVECPEFVALLQYINKDVTTWLPSSHSTIKEWVIRQYEAAKDQVKLELRKARSKIHISCDL